MRLKLTESNPPYHIHRKAPFKVENYLKCSFALLKPTLSPYFFSRKLVFSSFSICVYCQASNQNNQRLINVPEDLPPVNDRK